MAKRTRAKSSRQPTPPDGPSRPPLRLVGILFALLANLILVTLASLLAATWGWSRAWLLVASAAAALVAGVFTARFVGARAGIHAFAGGMLSVPLLGLITFGGDWQAAFYGGAFCALGGILMEKFVRVET